MIWYGQSVGQWYGRTSEVRYGGPSKKPLKKKQDDVLIQAEAVLEMFDAPEIDFSGLMKKATKLRKAVKAQSIEIKIPKKPTYEQAVDIYRALEAHKRRLLAEDEEVILIH